MFHKKILYLSVSLIFLFFLAGCSGQGAGNSPANEGKITVYTTIYPLSDFANKIAGDKGIVENIVPPGAEPHDFEPTPQDIIKLNQASIFVYNGAGFEGWVSKVLDSLENKQLIVVDSSKYVTLLPAQGNEKYDPHFWLDPNMAKKQAEAIKDALVKADPKDKEYFENNFKNLVTQFDSLDASLRDLAEHAKQKDIVVSHAAFGYLAHAYGIKEIPISGINPSEEPTQKDMRQIIETAKQNHIKYVLFEKLVSGKLADIIKNEVGAQALSLNSLESLTEDDLKQGKDYFSVMQDNIETLKTALNYSK